MVEAAEHPTYLGIPKMVRPGESCDSACEFLPDTKVGCLPSDLLAETDQAARDAGYCPFVCALSGLDVEIYVAGKVKAKFYRGIDLSNNLNNRHLRGFFLIMPEILDSA